MDVEEGLDTGGVLRRGRASTSGRDETADELRARLVEAGTGLLVDTLRRRPAARPSPRWASPPTPTKIHARRAASSTGTVRPSSCTALVRVGGAYTTFRGSRLKVWRTRAASTTTRPGGSRPSAGRRRRRCGRRPATAWLELVEVQPEGKAAGRAGRRVAARPASAPRSPMASAWVRRARRRGAPPSPGASARRGRPRRAGADRARRRLRQPGAARPCSAALEPRRARPRLRHRAGLRHVTPHAAGVRLAGRPVRHARARSDDPGRAAPRRLPAGLPRHAAPRRGQRHGRRWRRRRTRGLVNAVLRRVQRRPTATGPTTPPG